MTTKEQIKFDEMVAAWSITAEQKKAMEDFISDVSDDAYGRGIDAEAYSNAMSSY
jgi:hypothetical protein